MSVAEIKVPDLGDYKNVPVIEISVNVGDHIEKEQSLITLETDKATMDVPSPMAGIVKELHVKIGDAISAGALIVVLEDGNDSSSARTTADFDPSPSAMSTPAPQANSFSGNADVEYDTLV